VCVVPTSCPRLGRVCPARCLAEVDSHNSSELLSDSEQSSSSDESRPSPALNEAIASLSQELLHRIKEHKDLQSRADVAARHVRKLSRHLVKLVKLQSSMAPSAVDAAMPPAATAGTLQRGAVGRDLGAGFEVAPLLGPATPRGIRAEHEPHLTVQAQKDGRVLPGQTTGSNCSASTSNFPVASVNSQSTVRSQGDAGFPEAVVGSRRLGAFNPRPSQAGPASNHSATRPAASALTDRPLAATTPARSGLRAKSEIHPLQSKDVRRLATSLRNSVDASGHGVAHGRTSIEIASRPTALRLTYTAGEIVSGFRRKPRGLLIPACICDNPNLQDVAITTWVSLLIEAEFGQSADQLYPVHHHFPGNKKKKKKKSCLGGGIQAWSFKSKRY
jgi:hypothetical protein